MSVVGSQQRTLLGLLAALRPHWRRDAALPARIKTLLARRQFGSRDRRLYRELIYVTLRYLPWIESLLADAPERAVKSVAWLADESPATHAFRSELAGDWPAVTTLRARAEFLARRPDELLPAWFRDECPAAFEPDELETLLARAPLWLRVQTENPERVSIEFKERGWRWEPSPAQPMAWRVLAEVDVTETDAYAEGWIEVQDLGSQFVLANAGIPPGGKWLDACAGAGGKTLQLAKLLGPSGTIDAHDVRPEALAELASRAWRQRGIRPDENRIKAGAADIIAPGADSAAIRILAASPAGANGSYDGILIDAPCSGTGTWRRAPHLKWTTTPVSLAEQARRQISLLSAYASAVRTGGRLIYATCSLARSENEGVIEEFLQQHAEFECVPPQHAFGFATGRSGLAILPSKHNTDGFFVADLRRR